MKLAREPTADRVVATAAAAIAVAVAMAAVAVAVVVTAAAVDGATKIVIVGPVAMTANRVGN
jgi:hypothetical protein